MMKIDIRQHNYRLYGCNACLLVHIVCAEQEQRAKPMQISYTIHNKPVSEI